MKFNTFVCLDGWMDGWKYFSGSYCVKWRVCKRMQGEGRGGMTGRSQRVSSLQMMLIIVHFPVDIVTVVTETPHMYWTLTVVECSHLYGCCAESLTTWRPGRYPDVIDGVGCEVLEEVAGPSWRDGHMHILALMRVVVVQLVAFNDNITGSQVRWRHRHIRRVPRETDYIRWNGLTLEIVRHVWVWNSMHYRT